MPVSPSLENHPAHVILDARDLRCTHDVYADEHPYHICMVEECQEKFPYAQFQTFSLQIVVNFRKKSVKSILQNRQRGMNDNLIYQSFSFDMF